MAGNPALLFDSRVDFERGWYSLLKRVLNDAGLTFVAVLAGRWAAGETFGAVLWAGFIIPLMAGDGRRDLSAGWQTLAVVAVSLVGCLGLLPIASGVSLLLTCMTVTACALAAGLGGGAVATVCRLVWCAWFAAPCWVNGSWDNAAAGRLVAIQPAMVLNGIYSNAGDWSHQALAYRWLTKLGQDVEFDVPGRVWPCIAVHLGFAVLLIIFRRSTWHSRSARNSSTWNNQ